MKTRKGFVSNSSSTSFCMYGTTLDFSEMEELMEKVGIITDEMEEEEGDLGYWLQEYGYNKFQNLDIYPDSDGEICYVGRLWKYIKDDETGKQFKEDVKWKLKNCFNEEFECETIDETIYNG